MPDYKMSKLLSYKRVLISSYEERLLALNFFQLHGWGVLEKLFSESHPITALTVRAYNITYYSTTSHEYLLASELPVITFEEFCRLVGLERTSAEFYVSAKLPVAIL
jgi:hypothetical protein